MAKYEIKDYAIITFFSYIVVTILNVLIHYAFASVPILKTGFALILLMIAILLVLLFTYAQDGIKKDEIYALLIVVAIMIGIGYVVNHYIPDLFAVIPDGLKGPFSIIP
jgi:hypothetical protein